MEDELVVCVGDEFGFGVVALIPRLDDSRSRAGYGLVERGDAVAIDTAVQKILISLRSRCKPANRLAHEHNGWGDVATYFTWFDVRVVVVVMVVPTWTGMRMIMRHLGRCEAGGVADASLVLVWLACGEGASPFRKSALKGGFFACVKPTEITRKRRRRASSVGCGLAPALHDITAPVPAAATRTSTFAASFGCRPNPAFLLSFHRGRHTASCYCCQVENA